MAFIYDDGNVSVHIEEGSIVPEAKCFDLRDDDMKTMVKIDLLTNLPFSIESENLPDWEFVIEAMRSVHVHNNDLWAEWDDLRDDFLFFP